MDLGAALAGIGQGVTQGIANTNTLGGILDRQEALELQKREAMFSRGMQEKNYQLGFDRLTMEKEAANRNKIDWERENNPSIHYTEIIKNTAIPGSPFEGMEERLTKDLLSVMPPDEKGMYSRKQYKEVRAEFKKKLPQYILTQHGNLEKEKLKLLIKAQDLKDPDNIAKKVKDSAQKYSESQLKFGRIPRKEEIAEYVNRVAREDDSMALNDLKSQIESITQKQTVLARSYPEVLEALKTESEIAKNQAGAFKDLQPAKETMSDALIEKYAAQGVPWAVNALESKRNFELQKTQTSAAGTPNAEYKPITLKVPVYKNVTMDKEGKPVPGSGTIEWEDQVIGWKVFDKSGKFLRDEILPQFQQGAQNTQDPVPWGLAKSKAEGQKIFDKWINDSVKAGSTFDKAMQAALYKWKDKATAEYAQRRLDKEKGNNGNESSSPIGQRGEPIIGFKTPDVKDMNPIQKFIHGKYGIPAPSHDSDLYNEYIRQ